MLRLGILYLGRRGGIAHYTANLAHSLTPHATVTLYLSSYNDTLSMYDDIDATVHTVRTYRGLSGLVRSLARPGRLRELARRIDDDALDILLDTGAGPWAEPIKRALARPVHLVDVVHDPRGHADALFWPSMLMYAVLPRSAGTLVALCRDSTAQLAEDRPGKNHLSSRHGAILSSEHADPARAASLSKRMLFMGRIEPYKGLPLLIEALRRARERVADLQLSVLGRGRVSTELRRQMDALGVRLVNRWLSDDELADALDSHGVVVAPYRDASQSGVVAAAMARGRPTIVTDVGGLAEQVIHGETGWVVPPGAPDPLARAMIEAAREPDRLERRARANLRLARTTYAWSTIARELAQDLEDIAATAPPELPRGRLRRWTRRL